MTTLTRERLAELRGRVESDIAMGYINTGIGPDTVLTLIAQCEAGLPASGGVSGEGPMIDAKIALALSDAERAVADALGLLRNAAGNETWHAAVTEFLAKHGPSP